MCVKWRRRKWVEGWKMGTEKSDEREVVEERAAETRDQYFTAGC